MIELGRGRFDDARFAYGEKRQVECCMYVKSVRLAADGHVV